MAKTKTVETQEPTTNEIWKDIPNYLGFYQVSNKGRVRSLDRKVNGKLGSLVTKKGRILVPQPMDDGYVQVRLCINGKIRFYRIHQLVAMCFIVNPKPGIFNVINHKDEVKDNNVPENLEWCTVKYNNNYGSKQEKVRLKLINGKNSKSIIQCDLEGKIIKEWPSMSEAERQLGISNSKITACCKGKIKKAGGFIWKYKTAA